MHASQQRASTLCDADPPQYSRVSPSGLTILLACIDALLANVPAIFWLLFGLETFPDPRRKRQLMTRNSSAKRVGYLRKATFSPRVPEHHDLPPCGGIRVPSGPDFFYLGR